MYKLSIALCLFISLCSTNASQDVYCTNKFLNRCFENTANLMLASEKPQISNTPANFTDKLVIQTKNSKLSLLNIIVFGMENMTYSQTKIDLINKNMQFLYSNKLFVWRQKYVAEFHINGVHYKEEGLGDILFHNGSYLASYKLTPNTYRAYSAYSDFQNYTIDFSKLGDLESHREYKQELNNLKKNFANFQVEQACGNITIPFTQTVLNKCVL